MQAVNDPTPHYKYRMEPASVAILPVSTHEHWWTRQISDKTRNLIRKAAKSNVELRIVPLDDKLVDGIKAIYDESPVRQGKPFAHFGKPQETIWTELATFGERSTFIGAFLDDELIGFAKLVETNGSASLMHIISKICERNKAPNNAVVSKAVAICAERGIESLHYGVWSIGGLGMFKENHGFRKVAVPRYYVPITRTGRLVLTLGLHRSIKERVPRALRERLIRLRHHLMRLRPIAQQR
jgi:hypothetical protein